MPITRRSIPPSPPSLPRTVTGFAPEAVLGFHWFGHFVPERDRGQVQEAFEELLEKDTGIVAWVRAASSRGALSVTDPEMAGHQFKALLKAFAFWPQVTLGQPPLGPDETDAVITSAVDVFLSAYKA